MLQMISFEITVLIFLIILIAFFNIRNRLFTLKNRYYNLFMITLLLASVFCLCQKFTTDVFVSAPIGIMYFFTISSYVFSMINVLFFFIYILSVTHRIKYMSTFKYLLFFIPCITLVLTIISSPKTKSMFYINEVGRLITTDGLYMIPIVTCFYIGAGLFFIYKYKKIISRMQLFGIFFLIGMYVISSILQFAYDLSYFYILYSVIISVLVLYLAVQNPDYYINFSNGLLNKEAFKDFINEEIENNIPFNCVSIKIDEFNNLTEIYGTIKCDQLVKEIGLFLRKSFPNTSIFAVSSSQIIIVDKTNIPFPDFDQVISERFEDKWVVFGTEIKVNKSMCCVSYPEFYGNVDELLGIMKFAILESFKTNSMVIVGDYIINKMKHDIAVEKAVERAIEANAVQVYYQPIYSAKDKCITSAEALSRLIDDELGFIPPDEFIRVAEENGSILTLGKQIFEKVCVFIKENDLDKLNIHYIEVNLSPIQCMQKELATELISIADKYGLPMSKFNLEITESATTDSKDHIKINMEMLCDKNTTFSLDDYGTGFSNITAIMELPFKYVKIDKSIVWAYFDNTNSILEYLVHMFKRENLYIITEGVETKEQCDKLLEMGCDYLQGFYFSKAIPGEDFISYISA